MRHDWHNYSNNQEDVELIEACRWLQTLISDMNRQLVEIVSVAQYEHELGHSIMPMIQAKFEALDEESVEVLTDFFTQYGQMIRYHVATATRALLSCGPDGFQVPEGGSLEKHALGWVLDQPGIAQVVVGVEEDKDVDLVLGMKERGL